LQVVKKCAATVYKSIKTKITVRPISREDEAIENEIKAISKQSGDKLIKSLLKCITKKFH